MCGVYNNVCGGVSVECVGRLRLQDSSNQNHQTLTSIIHENVPVVSSMEIVAVSALPIITPGDGFLRTAVNCSVLSADWSGSVATGMVCLRTPGAKVTI